MKRILHFSILLLLGIIKIYPQDLIVTIPDSAFLYTLIDKGVDIDGDSLISYDEAGAVIALNVGGTNETPGEIADMTGIEAFVNLDSLICAYNALSDLDISNNLVLTYLDCHKNHLTHLDVSCSIALTYLDCSSNLLWSLDVSSNTALTVLSCAINILLSLDVSNNTALTALLCSSNILAGLDLSNNSTLFTVVAADNELESLILPDSDLLNTISALNNNLTNLDVSNNHKITDLNICGNPDLEEVCVWTVPFPTTEVDVCTEESPSVYFTAECN